MLAAAKAAFLARKGELAAERAAAAGDPIRGAREPTPFVRSLDAAADMPEPPPPPPRPRTAAGRSADRQKPPTDAASLTTTAPADEPQLSHFVTPSLLARSLAFSRRLAAAPADANAAAVDPAAVQRAAAAQAAAHARAATALERIVAVPAAASAQRARVNRQRCVARFGRHRTDGVLAPWKERATEEEGGGGGGRQRIGPDTGSSEVQIAMLTAKIRLLADEFAGRGRNDKVNKRNLRLLLHRRQKLLKYFRKKDRAGERWQHLVETLGLTPATWEGQIEVR